MHYHIIFDHENWGRITVAAHPNKEQRFEQEVVKVVSNFVTVTNIRQAVLNQ